MIRPSDFRSAPGSQPIPRVERNPRLEAVSNVILFGITIGMIKGAPYILEKFFGASMEGLP